MGYCGDCEHLTIRHNCKKYKKGLAYSSYISRSISTGAMHERCSECDKDYRIAELEEKIKHQWIPVAERLPEDGINPFTQDAYIYPVTVDFDGRQDVRYYSFCHGHWQNQGPGEMDDLVIAWMPRPEPYKEEEG